MAYFVPNPVLVIGHAARVKSTKTALMWFIFNGRYRQTKRFTCGQTILDRLVRENPQYQK